MTRRGLFGIFAAAGAVAAKPEVATKTVSAVAAPKPASVLIQRAVSVTHCGSIAAPFIYGWRDNFSITCAPSEERDMI